MTVRILPGKGLLDVAGFAAQGVHCGLKRKRRDMCVIVSDRPATAAAVFTQNAFAAPPIQVCREHLARGDIRALVCNSGNANACTGAQGLADAREMAAHTARALDLQPHQVLVASTGIIGRPMRMDLVRAGIDECVTTLKQATGGEAAEAITTTDTRHKEVLVEAATGGRAFHVAGIAKGAGMIHPNMATMLGFLVTDAPVAVGPLQAALRRAVDATFNMITVDGDQSTNDMVSVIANGAAGGPPLEPGSPQLALFEEALTLACRTLARMIASDGEGATVLLEVRVEGASTREDARAAARAVASSNLVKAALHGKDPNWGRVVAALGASSAKVLPERVSIWFEGNDLSVPVLRGGEPASAGPSADAAEALKAAEVRIRIDLGLGAAVAEAWGCDLTEGYVTFNSAYTT